MINFDEYCAKCLSEKHKPNKAMQKAARQGLEMRKKDKAGTATGIARARNIANGDNLSKDTINRMKSFFARHLAQWRKAGKPKDGKQYTALKLWGYYAGIESWIDKELAKYE